MSLVILRVAKDPRVILSEAKDLLVGNSEILRLTAQDDTRMLTAQDDTRMLTAQDDRGPS
jgi:hypothetical protein